MLVDMGVGSGEQGRGPPGFSNLFKCYFSAFLLFFGIFYRWPPLKNFLPTPY